MHDDDVVPWSLTTLRERLVKIGASGAHAPKRAPRRYPVFQLAEVAVPRVLFAAILCRIDGPRGSLVALA